jgi:hypothetical protein
MIGSIAGLVLIVAAGLAVSAWGIRRRHARNARTDADRRGEGAGGPSFASDSVDSNGGGKSGWLNHLLGQSSGGHDASTSGHSPGAGDGSSDAGAGGHGY